MTASLSFHADPTALADAEVVCVVGRSERLKQLDVRALLPEQLDGELYTAMVQSIDPGDDGRTTATWLGGDKPRRVVVGVLPEHCSRHNSESRAWAIPRLVASAGRKQGAAIVVAVDHVDHVFATIAAVAKAFPSYTAASRRSTQDVRVLVLTPQGPYADLARLRIVAMAVRQAAELVDRPPNELTTSSLVEIAVKLGRSVGANVQTIEGEALREQGMGGLYSVGQASVWPPALVVLDHDPGGATTSAAWVGKGIVYDTGGLSLKTKTGMPNMKNDMGGAAAVLAAFAAAVRLGCSQRLTAILCIAENSVGPRATRPDDVIKLYSGRSVEVNNTDAEGRLVLADGLAWAIKHRDPDVLIDCATLTGAQSVATGKRTAALYCNDEDLERTAVAAGRSSGDLVHPLPYVPEFFRREFASQIADMRNSVKDRSNAQSSCAGQFLENHLRGRDKPWLHVDLAAPAWSGGRGTGFGVGLLLTLAGVAG